MPRRLSLPLPPRRGGVIKPALPLPDGVSPVVRRWTHQVA